MSPKAEQNPYDKIKIEQLEARVTELQQQRSKLEEELRPHKDREYAEKQRAEDAKRNAERDAALISNFTRLEALVTEHVKDPALRPIAFEFALATRSMHAPFFGMWMTR